MATREGGDRREGGRGGRGGRGISFIYVLSHHF